MSIIKSNLVPFLLQVGIPFVVAIGAFFAVYAGYSNLKSQIETQKDLAEKAEKINQAFEKISNQEEVLSEQKNELAKQQEITANLHEEYTKQREFNQLLNQIQISSLGAKNGNRKDFESFYSLVEGDKLNTELHDFWEKEHNHLLKQWEGELEEVNFFRLYFNSKTGEVRKWSQEYLYTGISSLKTNRSWAYNNKDFAAYFKEIEVCNSLYFVESLYKIATEGQNISYSILAAKTLCTITEFEPYSDHKYANSYQQLLFDIPKFEKMKKWWIESGSKKEVYKCPFEKIVESDRNYYSYDRSFMGNNEERLNFLNDVIVKYPNLYRSKAEIAYLKLSGPETYSEVELLAQEAISKTDMEPLPYLILAYIGLKQNNKDKFDTNSRLAIRAMNKETMMITIQLNPKLSLVLTAILKFKILE